MSKPAWKLRTHIAWILLIKLMLIIGIRVAFFPSLEDQHPPADIYSDAPAQIQSVRSPHD